MAAITVNVTDAKNKLTQLLRAVEQGDTVTIERHGEPIATISKPVVDKRRKPRFGTLGKESAILDPHAFDAQNDIDEWLKGNI